ncbi:MAG: cellulase family glycosylhydrolase [Bacteroidota bacterium]
MLRALLVFTILLAFCLPSPAQSLINFRGGAIYFNGVNLPWNHFGWDIGIHEDKGIGYEPAYFEQAFAECSANGVNTVRFWLHCDGRASPEFDTEGNVIGLDPNFYEHLDDLIERAERHQIYLILCLWTFEIAEDRSSCCGRFAGNHEDLIQDPDKTQGYIDEVLIPMVQRYADRCNLLAWEIINEPEWIVADIDKHHEGVVSVEEMRRFVGMQAAAIHRHAPEQMVTLGAASFKWMAEYGNPSWGNLWSDQALQNASGEALAFLDFYQVHFYPWMKENRMNFDPYARPVSHWMLDKPILIGEAPVWNDIYQPGEMVARAFNNGYAGNLFWSYGGVDRFGRWTQCRNAIHEFSMMESALVDYRCEAINVSKETFSYHPNPVNAGSPIIIEATHQQEAQHLILIHDMQGKVVMREDIFLPAGKSRYHLSTAKMPPGVYLVRIDEQEAKKLLVY